MHHWEVLGMGPDGVELELEVDGKVDEEAMIMAALDDEVGHSGKAGAMKAVDVLVEVVEAVDVVEEEEVVETLMVDVEMGGG